jgi:hypothetical protein
MEIKWLALLTAFSVYFLCGKYNAEVKDEKQVCSLASNCYSSYVNEKVASSHF